MARGLELADEFQGTLVLGFCPAGFRFRPFVLAAGALLSLFRTLSLVIGTLTLGL